MDFVTDVLSNLSTGHGIVIALLWAAWKHFAGTKRGDIEKRVKEAAYAAWHTAKAVTGLTSEQVAQRAYAEAKRILARLKIDMWAPDVLPLFEHELELLAAEDVAAALPGKLGELADAAARVPAAFERGPLVPPPDPELFEVTRLEPDPPSR